MREWNMLPPAVKDAIHAIAEDRTSSASALARLALEAIGLLITEGTGRPDPTILEEAARRISDAQPSMAILHNVAHLTARLIAEGQDPTAVLAETGRELAAAREKIGRTFLKVAPDHGSIVTLSHSENVLEALRMAHGKGYVDRVWVMESRPLFEGRKLAASLSETGISVSVVTDALGPSIMKEAACALVGADSVLRDAGVINKIGTYALALGATDQKKPFYVVCESLKFDVQYDARSWPSPPPKEPQEVWNDRVGSVQVVNRYFEVTPGRLVTTFVTERGTYAPEVVRTLLDPRRSAKQ